MVFKNGVENIQAAGYNGARAVSKVATTARTCLSRASTRQEIFQYTKVDLYGLTSFRIMYKQIFSSARFLF